MSAGFGAYGRSFPIGRSYGVMFSPDGSMVAALGRNVVLWDAVRRRRIASAHPFAHPSFVDFSPDGGRPQVASTGFRRRSPSPVVRL